MDNDQTNPNDSTTTDNNNGGSAADIVDPDDTKHQQSKPPSVTGEENISGDMPVEPADIDEELKKVGLEGDEKGIKPLGED